MPAVVVPQTVGAVPGADDLFSWFDTILDRLGASRAVNLTALDPDILLPGFLAGLIVLATHVPLGREVLKRGIIFIDLAIAQVAGIGVIAAGAAGLDPHGLGPRSRPSARRCSRACS